MRTARHLVAAIWILINLYIWAVMSVPPTLTKRLPAGLSSYHSYHRALLIEVFSRPYVWSPEGK